MIVIMIVTLIVTVVTVTSIVAVTAIVIVIVIVNSSINRDCSNRNINSSCYGDRDSNSNCKQ